MDQFLFLISATFAATSRFFCSEFLDLVLYSAFTSFILFNMSFVFFFYSIFFPFSPIFFSIALLYPPDNLYIAFSCFSFSAGEYYFLFNSELADLIETVAFPWFLTFESLFWELVLEIWWEETTGLVGGLY